MQITNKTLTSAKEARRITSKEWCNNGSFRTSLDGKNQNECALYSDCILEFATEIYQELTQNPLVDLHEYNPDKLDLCIMASVFTYIQMVEPDTPEVKKISMSTTDVIRVMKMDNNYRPSVKEIQYITDRMNKLAATRLHISVVDNRNIKNKTITYHRVDSLIPARHEWFSDNSEMIADRWLLHDLPILYHYSGVKRINRLRTIGVEYYPALANRTEDYLILSDALALRVKEIKENHMVQPYITYVYERYGKIKGLFADCGIYETDYSSKSTWSQKKSKMHKQVLDILDNYKSNGLIKDYEIIKRKTSLYSNLSVYGIKVIC